MFSVERSVGVFSVPHNLNPIAFASAVPLSFVAAFPVSGYLFKP